MGKSIKMLACPCILIVMVLLFTCTAQSSTIPPANAVNDKDGQMIRGITTTSTEQEGEEEELTTFPYMSTDLPITTETIPPKDTTTVTTSTEKQTPGGETSTQKQSTASTTTPLKTPSKSTSKKPTTEPPPVTSPKRKTTESPSSSSTVEKPIATTKPDGSGRTAKPTNLLTVSKSVSSKTSSIDSGSTKDTTTDSNFLGVDKNSFTAKVILPIAAGIILAVFIVLIVCSIRSCLDRNGGRSSKRTMDHDMAPMDRVMLLADSSEDEF